MRIPIQGHVYVVQSRRDPSLFKIGMSSQVEQRLQNHNELVPEGIRVICVVPTEDCHRLEQLLHERFKHKRIVQEWFRLTAEDIYTIHKDFPGMSLFLGFCRPPA